MQQQKKVAGTRQYNPEQLQEIKDHLTLFREGQTRPHPLQAELLTYMLYELDQKISIRYGAIELLVSLALLQKLVRNEPDLKQRNRAMEALESLLLITGWMFEVERLNLVYYRKA